MLNHLSQIKQKVKVIHVCRCVIWFIPSYYHKPSTSGSQFRFRFQLNENENKLLNDFSLLSQSLFNYELLLFYIQPCYYQIHQKVKFRRSRWSVWVILHLIVFPPCLIQTQHQVSGLKSYLIRNHKFEKSFSFDHCNCDWS